MRAEMLTVSTSAGLLRGAAQDGYSVWRGIPFAAPPVGARRFHPPQPVDPWSGVRDATEFGDVCPQAPVPGMDLRAHESCLTINVTSTGPTDALRPVIVWLHPGGNRRDWSSRFVGDGEAFTLHHGLVVVTCNYRLGPWGFLHLSPWLGDEYATSGTLGLQDQLAALRWVQDNIAAFGGDPSAVTVFGASSGAKDAAALLATPTSRGLLSRVVLASGADSVATPDDAAALTLRLWEATGLRSGGPERLLELNADELLAAHTRMGGYGPRGVWTWRPVVDGVFVAGPPGDAIADGAATGIPLLVTTASREGATFAAFDPDIVAETRRLLAAIFHGDAERVVDAYQAAGLTGDDVWVAILGDERYAIPSARLADAQAEHAPVWRCVTDFVGHLPAPRGGHGSDLHAGWRLEDSPVPLALHDAIATFAHGSAPAADALPDWPVYEPARRATMCLGDDAVVVDDPGRATRAAWGDVRWNVAPWSASC
jgi:para-nitrobenzyl esterase